MNEVLIRFNSYEQTVQLFINGTEPSAYSELRNYTYEQFLNAPTEIVGAITRELNDDFALSVTGNPYENMLYAAAVEKEACCVSYTPKTPAVLLTSKERAERLGNLIAKQQYCVLLPVETDQLPNPVAYGNITLTFSNDPTDPHDLVSKPEYVILPFCETHLINPAIGRAVRAAGTVSAEIALCSRVTPIVQVSLPEVMETGTSMTIPFSVFPTEATVPALTIKAGNTDIVSYSGTAIKANAPGSTTVQVFIVGEADPIYSGSISVHKTVYVSKIEINGLDKQLQEGQRIKLAATAYPSDAGDLGSLAWEVSDPSIAEIRNGTLYAKSSGACRITAKTTKSECVADITVQAKLKKLHLSENRIEINVGQKAAISVQLTPHNAFDAAYKWETSDKSVAIVINDDGQEYVKAIGIGECTLTCASESGEIKDSCTVKVNSIMYKRKSTSKRPVAVLALILAVIVLFMVFGQTDASDPKEINVSDPAQDDTVDTEQDNVTDATQEQYIGFNLENGLSVEDIERFDTLSLEKTMSKFAEMYEMGYSEITSEPEITGRYFMMVNDPSYPFSDSWKGVVMQNCYAVLVRYSMYHFVYDIDNFWKLYVYPNCYYDEAGNLVYDEAQACVYNLNEYVYGEASSIPVCLESEFQGMSVKTIE